MLMNKTDDDMDDTNDDDDQVRPVTGKVANVILDNAADDDDDGDEFLIEEQAKDPLASLEVDPAMEVSGFFDFLPK